MNKVFILGILGLLISAGFIYFYFNPAEISFFPKCPFLVLTGLKCPGCGSQRAIHALLHLDFGAAFRYNAFLVSSLPVIVLLLFAELYRQRMPEFYGKVHQARFIWVYFAITLFWWMGRNIWDW